MCGCSKNSRKAIGASKTATSEILGIIAARRPMSSRFSTRSPKTPRGFVMLCDALIYRIDGDSLWYATQHGSVPIRGFQIPISRGFPAGRAVVDRQTIHVHDIRRWLIQNTPTLGASPGRRYSHCACDPLLREGIAIGVIVIRRTKSDHSPTNRSLCSKPSPTRP